VTGEALIENRDKSVGTTVDLSLATRVAS
jgi:hypothetical protein